jgi:uncharacterized protein (DUF1810 family)
MSPHSAIQDPHHLQRFLDAQASTYTQAHAELATGEKRTHWMWFIFPQIRGLGSSAMAQRYAIQSMEEARAYLAHPVLGPRLRECTALVNAAHDRAISDIFGYPDDLKFHSSITLFAQADDDANSVFQQALTRNFHGKQDAATLAILG